MADPICRSIARNAEYWLSGRAHVRPRRFSRAHTSTTATRWAAARFGSRVPHRHCLHPSQRYSLADAPAGTRVRVGDDVLVSLARLATQAGVWDLIHFALLDWLARDDQIDWSRAVVDSCSIRAVYGGDQTGPNPTDRAKRGSKRHLICDGRGVPLAVPARTGTTHKKLWPRWMRFPRCTVNGGDRGSGRTVCSGIAATTRRPFGAVSGLVSSCPCWPRAARSMGVAWARGGGSWSGRLRGSTSSGLARSLRKARRHPQGVPFARVRADLLAVAAEDVDDELSGFPLFSLDAGSH
jgi:hypothetical protein